jgi:hypothetical protein
MQDSPITIHTEVIVGLSKYDEEEITKIAKRNAIRNCKDLVDAYAQCTRDNYFPLKCRPMVKEMNDCVSQWTTEKHIDEIRRSYHNRNKD